jgi:hypothetical protein
MRALSLRFHVIGFSCFAAAFAACSADERQNAVETRLTSADTPCRSMGYWKKHPDAWRIELPLRLAPHVTLTQEQLLEVLEAPVRGNAVVAYFKQFIATLLNFANDAFPAPSLYEAVSRTIIIQYCPNGIPCTVVSPKSEAGQQIERFKDILDAFNNNVDGQCVSPPVCGNGIVETYEQCEPTVADSCPSGQSCNSACYCQSLCGNGVLDSGEQCEPGSRSACGEDLFCDPADCQCRNFPVCGNGILETYEQCEPSVAGSCPSGHTCTSYCYCQPPCGNGVLDPGEQCDPYSNPSADGGPDAGPNAQCGAGQLCNYDCTCQNQPVCGNGIIEYPYESCEPSVPGSCYPGSSCNANCWCQPLCGNGVLDSGEQCDPGANSSADGGPDAGPNAQCGANQICDYSCTCQSQSVCGNGVVEYPYESCDPGVAGSCGRGFTCNPTYCTCEAV